MVLTPAEPRRIRRRYRSGNLREVHRPWDDEAKWPALLTAGSSRTWCVSGAHTPHLTACPRLSPLRCRIKPYWIKAAPTAPRPALPAPGSALEGPPDAPAPDRLGPAVLDGPTPCAAGEAPALAPERSACGYTANSTPTAHHKRSAMLTIKPFSLALRTIFRAIS